MRNECKTIEDHNNLEKHPGLFYINLHKEKNHSALYRPVAMNMLSNDKEATMAMKAFVASFQKESGADLVLFEHHLQRLNVEEVVDLGVIENRDTERETLTHFKLHILGVGILALCLQTAHDLH